MTEAFTGVSPHTEKGKFEVCEKKGGEYYVRYVGEIDGLAACLFGLGISAKMVREGKEIYIVFNESDLPDPDDPDYEAQ